MGIFGEVNLCIFGRTREILTNRRAATAVHFWAVNLCIFGITREILTNRRSATVMQFWGGKSMHIWQNKRKIKQ